MHACGAGNLRRYLNDIWGQHVTAEHVQLALQAARSGPVQEGNVGGGTGMICHEFKGGIGASSRVLSTEQGGWTVGVLVQANYGVREALRVGGYPVGTVLGDVPSPFKSEKKVGSAGHGVDRDYHCYRCAVVAAPVYPSGAACQCRAGASGGRY